jgi:hypothetical protein
VFFNNGHVIYEFDRLTNQLFKAEVITLNHSTNKATINMKENHFYFTALNVKNAIKKIHNKLNVRYVIDATNE